MRVNYYTESFQPYLSGVTVSVDTFAKGLTNNGHQVTVFAPWYPDFEDKFAYSVVRFPSLGTKAYPGFRLALPLSGKHNEYNKQNPPDIIHSHSPFQLGFLAQRYALKNHLPFVYHFHTLFTEYLHLLKIPEFITRPPVIKLIQLFCQRCNLIIAPTSMVKTVLQNEYQIKQTIEILPTGIDDEAVALASPAGIREKYKLKPENFLLQYCGRLSKEKNIEFLLQAFGEINQVLPASRLMIVAFGPQEAYIKATAEKLGLKDKIIFTGRIERTEIYNYLKAADLFVCASKTETQGLVLSEAKACAKAVVAIKAAGAANMVIDNYDGYLTADNIADFSSKVIDLAKNPVKNLEFSQNALKNARENYFNSAIIKKLEKMYNQLVP